VNNFLKKPLDFVLKMEYIISMRTTKKDFEFTAALINAALNGVAPEHLATMAATKFTEDNPRFDADRFKRACGLTWQQIDCE
jgi:hypothetical protein